MTTDPQNLLPGLHEAMRLLKQNDLDYGPGRILERIKELGGETKEDFWVIKYQDGRVSVAFSEPPSTFNVYGVSRIIHCREVVES